jgi:hypothetical protein
MKSHCILKISIVLLILTSRHLVAQGNLVMNGSFDTDATGWTLTNGAAWIPDKIDPGGFIGLDSLAPSPTTDPTAYQLINGLTLGQVYLVSGDYEKEVDRTSIAGLSFGVALDDVFLFEASVPGDFHWHTFSFLYTATSTSAVLSLSSQINGTGVSYDIDNIGVYAIPEPSAFAFIFLGSGLLVYVRNRNQQTSNPSRIKCLN